MFSTLLTRLGLDNEPWVAQLGLILVGALFAHFLAHVVLRHAQRVTALTPSAWDDALFEAARRPLPALVWVIALSMLFATVREPAALTWFDSVQPFREIGIVLCLAWFLLRFSDHAAANVIRQHEARGEEVDHTTVDAISKLARLVTLIVTVLIVMQTLGFSVSGLLAAGGIGGIAIGFAAKDLLANFFGGLTIYMDRPFSVGDWIRSPDKDIEGTVEYISWRHTRVRRFNKNPLYVPNAVFTSIAVENPSRMSHRRIKETIGLRYQDIGQIAAIVAEVKAMLQNHPEIDTRQTLIVNFNTFGPSALDFFIYTFTKTVDWTYYHTVKQDVLLKVAVIIAQHGAEIAYPTQTVHLQSSPIHPPSFPDKS